MTRNTIMLFIFFLAALLTVSLLINNAEAAELTHAMKNGVSFSSPSDWVLNSYGTIDRLCAILTSPDKKATIALIMIEGIEKSAVLGLAADKDEWQRRLGGPQEIEVHSFKKDSVAGREAIRTEYTIELAEKTHSLTVQLHYGEEDADTDNWITITLSSTDKDVVSKAENVNVFEGILGSLILR